jgi:excisionase family DNA binding protein
MLNENTNTKLNSTRRRVEASEPNDELITKDELARRLWKSKRTIELWVTKGILPSIKIQRSVLFPWGDVQDALRAFYRKGGAK